MTLRDISRRAAPAALVAIAALAAAAPAVRAQPAAPPQNVMTLSATAAAEAPTDLLTITFSTAREGSEAAAVQSQLKQALDAALAEARKAARPGQVEVRTGNFSLVPRHAPKGGIVGWQGTAQLVVEGRDMTTIAQLAGRIQTLGVARVAYALSREAREKLEAETTAQAIARFRERAQAQAQAFGFGGYQIREVQVGTQEPPSVLPVQAMRLQAAPALSDAALPVEPGKATVSATVSGSVQMTK